MLISLSMSIEERKMEQLEVGFPPRWVCPAGFHQVDTKYSLHMHIDIFFFIVTFPYVVGDCFFLPMPLAVLLSTSSSKILSILLVCLIMTLIL